MQRRYPLRIARTLFWACLLCCSLSLQAQDAEGVYAKVDENPAPIKALRPTYPEELKKDKVGGLVAVAVVIDETGAVLSAKITKSTNTAFEQPSLDAILQWKFRPGVKDGKPVKVRVVIPLRFSAEEESVSKP